MVEVALEGSELLSAEVTILGSEVSAALMKCQESGLQCPVVALVACQLLVDRGMSDLFMSRQLLTGDECLVAVAALVTVGSVAVRGPYVVQEAGPSSKRLVAKALVGVLFRSRRVRQRLVVEQHVKSVAGEVAADLGAGQVAHLHDSDVAALPPANVSAQILRDGESLAAQSTLAL